MWIFSGGGFVIVEVGEGGRERDCVCPRTRRKKIFVLNFFEGFV